MNYFTESLLDSIADALVTQGYCVLDDALPATLVEALLLHFDDLRDHAFKAAGIGRQQDFQLAETIRSDHIHWLSADADATGDFLQWMDSLRIGMNRRLFMGLFDYESHFAYYPVGGFYKKHLDAFKGKSNRVLSTVFYLNPAWQSQYGGELIIYAEDGEQLLERVVPSAGRLVIFLSEKFPHEVLPASCERKSIAGWFRINEGKL